MDFVFMPFQKSPILLFGSNIPGDVYTRNMDFIQRRAFIITSYLITGWLPSPEYFSSLFTCLYIRYHCCSTNHNNYFLDILQQSSLVLSDLLFTILFEKHKWNSLFSCLKPITLIFAFKSNVKNIMIWSLPLSSLSYDTPSVLFTRL